MTERAAIARLAEAALDRDHPVRAALLAGLAASSGLHPASLGRLTDLWAHAWRSPGVERLWSRGLGSLGGGWAPLGTVAVVAPGNLPVATWQAVLEPLLCGDRVRVRPGSGDPLAPGNLRSALAILAPDLAARIDIHPFDRTDAAAWAAFLAGTQALSVQGSDEAVASVLQLAGQAGFCGRVRGQGHLQSLAVIAADVADDLTALAGVAAGLAEDALLADGRGCMSLRAVWLLGASRPRFARVHATLAQAMATAAQRLPPGRLDPRWQAAQALAGDDLAFAAAADPNAALVTAGPDWWLATLLDDRLLPVTPERLGPGARALVVRGATDAEDLAAQLAPWAHRLSTVALAGKAGAPWPAALDRLAPHRRCPPGQMQAPPADRAPDGHLPLVACVRVLDPLEPRDLPAVAGG